MRRIEDNTWLYRARSSSLFDIVRHDGTLKVSVFLLASALVRNRVHLAAPFELARGAWR